MHGQNTQYAFLHMIILCSNQKCDKKYHCFRAIAPIGRYVKNLNEFKPRKNGYCPKYVESKTKEQFRLLLNLVSNENEME